MIFPIDFETIPQEEQDAVKEIIQIIQLKKAVYSVDYNSIKISDGHVVAITLIYTKLPELPPSVSQFSMLERANLFCNQFTEIPDLTTCIHLKYLGLGGNRIQKIDHLSCLNELESLELGRNQIQKIEHLDSLANLRTLNFNSNLIEEIEGLDALKSLEYLNLSSNQIKKMEHLNHLIALKELILDHNQIKSIDDLEALAKLQTLLLNNNKIEQISGLGSLARLEELNLEMNPLNPEFQDYALKSPQAWVALCQSQSLNITAPIISFIGHSGSGKTASIEAIIQYLNVLQKKCITIKHIHQENFTADTPGKNTARFSEAGSKVSVAQSVNESAVFFNWSLPPMRLISWIQSIGQEEAIFDPKKPLFVLLEGFREIPTNLVLCVNSYLDLEEQFTPEVKAIAGVISNNEDESALASKQYGVPVIDIISDPEELFVALNLVDLSEAK